MKTLLLVLLLFAINGCARQISAASEPIIDDAQKDPALSHHAQSTATNLPTGTWEGINRSGALFMVLNITADGQHSLSSFNIASGMQFSKRVSFSDKDILCDAFSCQIFTQTADEQLPLKISLTYHIEDDLLATEMTLLQSGAILSSGYRLHAVNSTPAPQRFIAQQADKIKAIAAEHKHNRFGFWSGILEKANEDQLYFATLDYQPDQTATFTVYRPGYARETIMTFDPEGLEQKNGELTVSLDSVHFASQLTLRYALNDVIEGDFEQRFDRYPERLISHGNFQLYRVKLPEDYTRPKWLDKLLKE
ncbi:MAG: hypothetical protein GYB58_19230 [Gammaproteobacteria bacterium]|nr:hypothetical protein [Gammaproteobacteria bacterium]